MYQVTICLFCFFVVNCIIPNFVDVNQTNNVAMKNKLVLYLLVSLVASCIYPVTVWAKVNERFSLKNESVSEQIPLTKKLVEKQEVFLSLLVQLRCWNLL